MQLRSHITAVCLLLLLQIEGITQQPCDESHLMSIKGSWKKRTDSNPFPDTSFPKSQFSLVKSRIDQMQKILQAAYPEPKGTEAGWYRCISGKALVQDGPVPFELTAMFPAYYCNHNSNATELGDETGTWLYVWANHLSWFAERVDYYKVNKQPVYLLTERAGELNGSPLYRGIHNSNSNGITHCSAQILTRSGQSPYLPVDRKTFLRLLLKRNEKRFNESMEVQKNISGRTDQQKEKLLAMFKKTHEDEIKPAQDYLANSSESELAQPAIIVDLTGFKSFRTIEKGGQELVRLNPAYFDTKLPRYVPQFLIVYWRWEDRVAGQYFNKQVEEHFNFTALKEMIDK
jgi:hypothetical protein